MERAPNAWDRFYRFQKAPWRGERRIEDLAPYLVDPILELGVGNGKALRPLQAAGHDVVGLDVSWHCLRRLGTGVLANATHLPFANESLGTVLDVHCTGHLLADGRAEALQEMARVVRPGGFVIVERLGRDDLRSHKGDPVEPHTRQLADGRTTHFSDPASLEQELEAAGLHLQNIHETRRTPRLRGLQVIRSSVRAVANRPG